MLRIWSSNYLCIDSARAFCFGFALNMTFDSELSLSALQPPSKFVSINRFLLLGKAAVRPDRGKSSSGIFHVQFSSGRDGIYVLQTVSRKFSQLCLWNGSTFHVHITRTLNHVSVAESFILHQRVCFGDKVNPPSADRKTLQISRPSSSRWKVMVNLTSITRIYSAPERLLLDVRRSSFCPSCVFPLVLIK